MDHIKMFGNASWVGCGDATSAPCFRSSFTLPELQTAEITICGLGFFELYLNGQKVSEDLFVPVTSDYVKRPFMRDGKPFDEEMRHRCYCLCYDVKQLLHEGKNELAVAVGPGFFGTTRDFFGEKYRYGEARLCYRLLYTACSGESGEILSSEESVRWHPGLLKETNFVKEEIVDLNRLPEDWKTADYSDWQPVSALPPMDTEYELQDCPADRIARQITPRMIRSGPSWKLYDCGENITGWVILQDEEKAGKEIRVIFSEMLNHGVIDRYGASQGQNFYIISDGKHRTIHPQFTWFGFRYFLTYGNVSVKTVAVIHSELPEASAFRSSNQVLNWLYDAYARTQRMNWHVGIPSDCPHLERNGYTGDGQLTCESGMIVLNNRALYRKWIRDILDCQDPRTGHVQYTAPYVKCGGGPGGWGCAIAVVPMQYYRYYGEKEVLEAAYPGMCRYIDYLRAHSENGLVTSDQPGYWCLGDWCAPAGSRIARPFVNTYFMVKSLRIIQETEKILGKPVQPVWEERIREACDAMTAAYLDPETGDFAEGIEGANAFAVDIGLGDERTFANLKKHYEELGGYDTGIFGTEIVTRVFFEHGEEKLAYRLLTSENEASFAGWMKEDATTIWEYWPGSLQRSYSHPMFGAVTKELFHYVLGIRQEEGSAGWDRVLIRPVLTGEVPDASGYITTPHGKLAVELHQWERRQTVTVEVPEGMSATLEINGKRIALKAGKQSVKIG